MKKVLMILAAICMTMAANAKILRVSNVSGSSAPYATFDAAQEAAAEGDTIMFDASPNSYGNFEVIKRLVLIGPGYWLSTNGIVEVGEETAELGDVIVKVENCVFKGLTLDLTIRANKTVVNRCYLRGLALRNASNSIIHQNFIRSNVEGYGSSYEESYIQLTNNIIKGRISDLTNSYIAYNTLTSFFSCDNCAIEYNIGPRNDTFPTNNGNNSTNNLVSDAYNSFFNAIGTFTDQQFYNIYLEESLKNTYGVFAGTSPYVISGVPSGPIITDLEMPTTVEVGSTPTVTIKVSISK